MIDRRRKWHRWRQCMRTKPCNQFFQFYFTPLFWLTFLPCGNYKPCTLIPLTQSHNILCFLEGQSFQREPCLWIFFNLCCREGQWQKQTQWTSIIIGVYAEQKICDNSNHRWQQVIISSWYSHAESNLCYNKSGNDFLCVLVYIEFSILIWLS